MCVENWREVVEALTDRPELHDAWINGLGYNPAATGAVLWRVVSAGRRLSNWSFWLEFRDLTDEAAAVLVRHPDPKIRLQLAQNPNLSWKALVVLAEDEKRLVREFAAVSVSPLDSGPATSMARPPKAPLARAEAQALVDSSEPELRAQAAWDERVPQDLALTLSADPDDKVRRYLSMREDLSEEQRAAIPYVVLPWRHHRVPEWLTELMDDPAAIAAYADSSHVLIRRTVAMARSLPAATVASLAEDEDFFVRLNLAEYCDGAPRGLIIEMYRYWHDDTWSKLRFRPNFLRLGMAAEFATDPNPRLRWAALIDPTASPEIVEKLSHDRHGQVFPAANSDHRLPLARLHEALGVQRTASSAAGNPQLPEWVMHALLDYAGVDPV
jgi:hypothetical protein